VHRRICAPAAAACALLLGLAWAVLPASEGAEDSTGREWVEAAYAEHFTGDLRAARERYEAIAARRPGHPRAPEALLRAALCLEKAGDIEGARALAQRVLSGDGTATAARPRAEELLARLEGLSARAARERESEAAVRENEALKLNLAALQGRLDQALASLRRGAQDDAQRRAEVEGLRSNIEELSREGERLREKLKSLQPAAKEEQLTPEEILSRLEQANAVKEEQRRFLAENYFRTGVRLEGEERLQEALENFRQCLALWDGHPKAREHLLRVGSLLGDPESRQKEILNQLEIAKELRIQEAKVDLGNAFREAFEWFRKANYEEAWKLFRKALDILVRDLPEGPEFDRQKDLAARYIRLCQREMKAAPAGAEGSVEVRVRVLACSGRRLAAIAGEVGLTFGPCGSGVPGGALAAVPAARKEALEKAFSGAGAPLLDEKLVLSSGVSRVLEKAGPGGVPSPFALTLAPRIEAGRLDLEASAKATFPPGRALDLPGSGGPVGAAAALTQEVSARLDIPAGGAILLAGLGNPFAKGPGAAEAGELLIVIETVG
jgi:tetratricopeptide (TPR) repeat protein